MTEDIDNDWDPSDPKVEKKPWNGPPVMISNLIIGKHTWIGDLGDTVEDRERYVWKKQGFHAGGNGKDDPDIMVEEDTKVQARLYKPTHSTNGALNIDKDGYGPKEWREHERRSALFVDNMEQYQGTGAFVVPYPPKRTFQPRKKAKKH